MKIDMGFQMQEQSVENYLKIGTYLEIYLKSSLPLVFENNLNFGGLLLIIQMTSLACLQNDLKMGTHLLFFEKFFASQQESLKILNIYPLSLYLFLNLLNNLVSYAFLCADVLSEGVPSRRNLNVFWVPMACPLLPPRPCSIPPLKPLLG